MDENRTHTHSDAEQPEVVGGDSAGWYKPAQVAKRLAITPSYLRKLSERGLVEASGRTKGGHRRYSEADVERVRAALRGEAAPMPAASSCPEHSDLTNEKGAEEISFASSGQGALAKEQQKVETLRESIEKERAALKVYLVENHKYLRHQIERRWAIRQVQDAFLNTLGIGVLLLTLAVVMIGYPTMFGTREATTGGFWQWLFFMGGLPMLVIVAWFGFMWAMDRMICMIPTRILMWMVLARWRRVPGVNAHSAIDYLDKTDPVRGRVEQWRQEIQKRQYELHDHETAVRVLEAQVEVELAGKRTPA